MAFAGPPLPITPVNSTTASEQTHSSVVGLAGSGHVFTWRSEGQDGSSGGIYAQMFDANGLPVGAEVQVNTTTTGNQAAPEIAALTGGGYVITWESEGQDGDFTGVYMQRYDAAGVAQGGETLVNTTTIGAQGASELIGLSTGGFAVVWADSDATASVRMQFFDAAGLPVGGEVIVATLAAGHYPSRPQLTELPNGRIAVAWSDAQFGLLDDDPYFQLVRANGTLFGGPTQMNTTPGALANQTQIVALSGGGFMAVWTESIGATGAVGVGDARIVGRIYDSAGGAVTDEFTVSDEVTHLRYDPAVTLGGDGNVYVGWLEQTGNGEVYVMRGVDPAGNLLGDQFYIGDLVPIISLNRFLDITTLANGDVVATWQSWFGTSDIVTRTIYTNQSDPRVSDLADTVALLAGGEVLDARAGDDDIAGGTGDDIVFGNDGADTLIGSGGSDFLNGGKGADSLDGNAGADILQGGDGDDVLNGNTGDDTILGEDQSDTIDGGAGNNSIQGGAGADDIAGGADNDLIWGDHNAFAVWTDGSGAADTLYGGSGNDTVYGGSGDDVIEGGDGDDVLFGDGPDHDGWVAGDDLYILSAGRDTMNGWDGIDTVDASGAVEALNVNLNPYGGSNQGTYGSSGTYNGTLYYVENVIGSGFNDTMSGDAMANAFTGKDGDDSLAGRDGRDTLTGNGGSDTLLGEDDKDFLDGGAGADSLYGGGGNDTLDGGTARDGLFGGGGDDVFLFVPGSGKDTIEDYDQGRDAVALNESLWGGGLTAQQVLDTFGTLSASGKKFTLDFGGGDVLVLKDRGIDLGTLADDFTF